MPQHTVDRVGAGADRLVRLGGEIDVAAAPDVSEALAEAIVDSTGRLVVDLGPCTFLDSTGLGLLIAANKRLAAARRDPLVIRGATSTVLHLLAITGLDRVFTIEGPAGT